MNGYVNSELGSRYGALVWNDADMLLRLCTVSVLTVVFVVMSRLLRAARPHDINHQDDSRYGRPNMLSKH